MEAKKEKMEVNLGEMEVKTGEMEVKTEATETKYVCTICNRYYANNKQLQKHFSTLKHKNKLNPNPQNEKKNCCRNCNKEYANSSGLWKHMQKCNKPIEDKSEDEDEQGKQEIKEDNHQNKKEPLEDIILYLIKENKEMKDMLYELAKNSGNGNNSHNNSHNNNKTFNLQFFLNETCKNAMNLSDFVKGVVVSMDDLEETGRIGYVNGVSRIFCNELKKLDICDRPIHCSDAKRETIYIRENNQWEKDENYEKLMDAIKKVSRMNVKLLPAWQKKHPGWNDPETKENDRYLNMLLNIMCDEDEVFSNQSKIMKNVIKITVIDKEEFATIQ